MYVRIDFEDGYYFEYEHELTTKFWVNIKHLKEHGNVTTIDIRRN